MDKFIRNINELLWREVKAEAALEGISMKDWVEEVIGLGLAGKITVRDDVLHKYRENDEVVKAKLLRNINEELWMHAKAKAALEGKTMKDFIEGLIAQHISDISKTR